MKLEQDWHIHTYRSLCGKPENTIQAIVEAVDKAALKLAGISDHIDTPEQRAWFEDVIEHNRADLASLSPTCRVLVGTEASMLAPDKCALDADLAAELDFVIVACNHYHLDVVENPTARTPEAYASHYLDMLSGAAALGFATTIPHPFVHSKLSAEDAGTCLRCYDLTHLSDVLRTAADADMAFEINPGHARQAIEWFRDFLQEARRWGVRFTLGSDSHTLAGIGYPANGDEMSPWHVCEAIGLRESDLKWPALACGL